MEINKIDCLEYLKGKNEYEFDLIFSDPPYALGSELTIKNGKVDYKKARDFMAKWEMPTGEFWEQFFIEAYRTLKHGGYCIMFGIDRQNILFKYYALNAGFVINQSLYWYFISNFPKSSDLSKNLDKHFGAERERIEMTNRKRKSDGGSSWRDMENRKDNITSIPDYNAKTPLAKKYNGYKYSISPLKQCQEEIMIFQKPYKTKSCLHDVLAYEDGDKTIACGAMDIDRNRVSCDLTKEDLQRGRKTTAGIGIWGNSSQTKHLESNPSGRYPAQTFTDSEAAEILDAQSGELKNGGQNKTSKIRGFNYFDGDVKTNSEPTKFSGQIGGCSKILHKCDYEAEDYDILNYCPKVSPSERNAGLEEKWNLFEQREAEPDNFQVGCYGDGIGNVPKEQGIRPNSQKNFHPCLKPIKLITKILRLFKTPNPQKIYFPFAGSGSEIIGGIKAGFTDWVATEINEEYIKIAEARIKHWTQQNELF